ncbi:Cytokinin dehydrogenase 3 [Abeliophyllum distichum]|uniref:Cytokinin dehydrogenase 3 n=1 Tax=Abeliophyllum distichum TaxID=126358 RepID=A0ABD1TKY7_9LAMI
MVKYYDDETANSVDKVRITHIEGLNFIPGFTFMRDETYVDFLNRVRRGEITLKSKGLWDVPNPCLNLLVPKSRWDDKMSAVVPDEDIFYSVGLLHSGSFNDWQDLDNQNNEILDFCDRAGIKMKQYLPHYKSKEEWIKHVGPKWNTFQERKAQFDPRMILSPGQNIFNYV